MMKEKDFFDFSNDINSLLNILEKFQFGEAESKYMYLGFDQLMVKNYSDASKFFESAYMENPRNSIISFLKIYCTTFTILRGECESALETLYLSYIKLLAFIENYPDLKDDVTSVFLKLYIIQENNLYDNLVYKDALTSLKDKMYNVLFDTIKQVDSDEASFTKTRATIADLIYYELGGEEGYISAYREELLKHLEKYNKELYEAYLIQKKERGNVMARRYGWKSSEPQQSTNDSQKEDGEVEERPNKFKKFIPLIIIGGVLLTILIIIFYILPLL